MRHKQNLLCAGRCLTLVLLITVYGFALPLVKPPAQAASGPLPGDVGVKQQEEFEPKDPGLEMDPQEPPEWWYDPNAAPVPSALGKTQEPPVW